MRKAHTLLLFAVLILSLGASVVTAQNEESKAESATATTSVETGAHKSNSEANIEANKEANRKTNIEKKNINDLIVTLESETARAELIDQLKVLIDVQEKEETSDLPSVGELLNLDKTSDGITDQYIDTLETLSAKMGLSRDLVGNTVFIIAAIVIVLLVVVINSWSAKYFDKKLSGVREKFNLSPKRFSLYFSLQKGFGYVVGSILLVYALSKILDFRLIGGDSSLAEIALEYSVTLFVLIILFVSIWEIANAVIEFTSSHVNRFSNRRMETLLPIVRNLLLCTLVALSLLMILSEIGIDIMPLLAGAGVLGIAVGFGAQTLVKDFLTGFIIIFEDLLQVGDVVRIGDRRGAVEVITIRKIQLRDLDGTVHTIPFSEVSIVDNLTKDFSYYLFEVGVAYREDTDEVVACLQEIGEALEATDEYTDLILAPLEILGVDHFADSAVIIKARIKTRAHDKWKVGREFNRRMKHAFDEKNIEIPFPHQTIYFGEDKEGKAPQAAVRLVEHLIEKEASDKQ